MGGAPLQSWRQQHSDNEECNGTKSSKEEEVQQNEAHSKNINAELVTIDCDEIANPRMESQNTNHGRRENPQVATYQNGKLASKGNFLGKEISDSNEDLQATTSLGNLSAIMDIESPLLAPSNAAKEGTNL